MTDVQVQLPEDTFSVLRKSPAEVATEMRVAVAISWFARGLLSQGKAAEVAGLTRAEFIDALAAQGVCACQESIEELREVLACG